MAIFLLSMRLLACAPAVPDLIMHMANCIVESACFKMPIDHDGDAASGTRIRHMLILLGLHTRSQHHYSTDAFNTLQS